MARSGETRAQANHSARGPARLLGRGEVLLSLTYAAAAAHCATLVKDLPNPYADILLGVCVAAVAFGFGWAAFRLVRPRQNPPSGL